MSNQVTSGQPKHPCVCFVSLSCPAKNTSSDFVTAYTVGPCTHLCKTNKSLFISALQICTSVFPSILSPKQPPCPVLITYFPVTSLLVSGVHSHPLKTSLLLTSLRVLPAREDIRLPEASAVSNFANSWVVYIDTRELRTLLTIVFLLRNCELWITTLGLLSWTSASVFWFVLQFCFCFILNKPFCRLYSCACVFLQLIY